MMSDEVLGWSVEEWLDDLDQVKAEVTNGKLPRYHSLAYITLPM
jgi:hypothetical protein